MIIDASALVAIILDEPDAEFISSKVERARDRMTHAVSVYEAALAVARGRGQSPFEARRDVELFLKEAEVTVVGLGPEEASAAVDAFFRYGKGRHPAALNMGDCFSYACAKLRGMPLLYKGEDFAKTDLA
ncbi:type II toxin-antitoxin system VapC family toxin [uncultured Enterovirga sp.]|uniref:type II toxin-antitoxin system VapC family toxin n=1 Tax=uncultured Enterovirga sp. TaxID=2026352 RepID=UPI0035C9EA93